MKSPVWELFRDYRNRWRFRLRAANGEIVLQSEAYASRPMARKGIAAIKRSAGGRIIVLQK